MIPDLYWLVHAICAVPAFYLGWKMYEEEGAPNWVWKLPPATGFALLGPLGLFTAIMLRRMQQTGY